LVFAGDVAATEFGVLSRLPEWEGGIFGVAFTCEYLCRKAVVGAIELASLGGGIADVMPLGVVSVLAGECCGYGV